MFTATAAGSSPTARGAAPSPRRSAHGSSATLLADHPRSIHDPSLGLSSSSWTGHRRRLVESPGRHRRFRRRRRSFAGVDEFGVRVDHSLQAGSDSLSLGRREIPVEVLLDSGAIDRRSSTERRTTCGCDRGKRGPTIARIGHAFDETCVCQFGDQATNPGS